jgi:nitrile hydratase subunit beta
MNGIHDMGGMQDMGRIQCEKDEPVFHAAWEGRVYAIDKSLRATGKWNLDAWRRQIELIPPVDYLRMTYYERWLHIDERLLVLHELVTSTELTTGSPEAGSAKAVPALSAASAARSLGRGIPSSHDPSIAPLFKVGQRVRARDINPVGHTRLPRYARGRIGTITIDHGVYTFPDTNAQFLGERRQHVYSVQFTARELWGENASPRDRVNMDMWDDYLELA